MKIGLHVSAALILGGLLLFGLRTCQERLTQHLDEPILYGGVAP